MPREFHTEGHAVSLVHGCDEPFDDPRQVQRQPIRRFRSPQRFAMLPQAVSEPLQLSGQGLGEQRLVEAGVCGGMGGAVRASRGTSASTNVQHTLQGWVTRCGRRHRRPRGEAEKSRFPLIGGTEIAIN